MSIKKTLTVEPEEEEAVIAEWESFGYNLLSSQEIDNHVKLVFEYNTAKPNAKKLLELLRLKHEIESNISQYERGLTGIFWFIAGFCVLFGIIGISTGDVSWLVGVAVAVGGIAVLILFIIIDARLYRSHEKENNKIRAQLQEIEAERSRLMQ